MRITANTTISGSHTLVKEEEGEKTFDDFKSEVTKLLDVLACKCVMNVNCSCEINAYQYECYYINKVYIL